MNAPNITIVSGEASFDTKVLNPIGFQVIEELLYDEPLDTVALQQIVKMTSARLKMMKNEHITYYTSLEHDSYR